MIAIFPYPFAAGLPLIIGIVVIALGVAGGTRLAMWYGRRWEAKAVRIAQANGRFGNDGGLVVKTYGRWGFFHNGYLLVDDDNVILQDRHRNTMRAIRRDAIRSVNCVQLTNFLFIFNLRDGSSVKAYTFKPAAGNPYTAEIANELHATGLTRRQYRTQARVTA